MELAGREVPRRLIEVDLPIAAISAHARDGRSVHHGHITAIHIWWARKPLPACRSVLLAALLPDPVDPACPEAFREAARTALAEYDPMPLDPSPEALRRRLLRLVSDYGSWQVARDRAHVAVVRRLVEASQRALYEPGRALLADPFCGGGSIPLEGLRLGAQVFASDLNPVAALISKVTLEYAQRHGAGLLDEVERAATAINARLADALARFYPPARDGAPVAYLSFRKIRCDGPQCGADVVLTSKFLLSRRPAACVGLVLAGWDGPSPRFEVREGAPSIFPHPTVRRGAATCLRCGFTMPVERVREQLSSKRGGSRDALLVAVATTDADGTRRFRDPRPDDREGVAAAEQELVRRDDANEFPDEPLPPAGTLGFRVQRYGMTCWRDLYTARQLLTLSMVTRCIREVLPGDRGADGLGVAVRSCLALAADRLADYQNTGCSWNPSGSALPHLFTRQAVPIIWDFGEANPLGGSAGSWLGAVEHVVHGLRNAIVSTEAADVGLSSASHHPLPTDCAHVLVTDPPYYDAIPYADLSDFFYVWLKRSLASDHPSLFATPVVPREDECIVNRASGKDRAYYRRVMTAALAEGRRVTRPDGIGVVIFAHKSTAGWEDQLAAMIEAGWIITASWPIDTENAGRLRARNSAVLASSIHLVCRPREHADGRLVTDSVGDWRAILIELPDRIQAWMPRLAAEGVVGADAIFACLGPALELFSRYARVEKVSGEPVALAEYLEHVWAAVARGALSMIFDEVDTTGLEPDARLTSIWLWTLAASSDAHEDAPLLEGFEPEADEPSDATSAAGGYVLEYDAARKIAQGLGARLEELDDIVSLTGATACLRAVRERRDSLLGAAGSAAQPPLPGAQAPLFDATTAVDSSSAVTRPAPGATTLDRLHQAMLLFADGRAEALRRFLVDDAVGNQRTLWRLAQALSALYPKDAEEKRWLDGVLARKRGLGFG